MGVRWFFSALFWVGLCVCALEIVAAAAQKGFTICDVQGCNCTVRAASWKNVNCNLHMGQVVTLEADHVPREAFEIFIAGGEQVTFSARAFNSLAGLTLVRIDGARKIVMEKKSFFDINSSSLLIQIQNCDELIVKTGAFEYVQSSISTEITGTSYITIEQAAFGKLYSSTFVNVNTMILDEGSFDFKHQGSIGRHGPVTVISFDNVVIPKIPRETFLTSLASITFRNCRIGEVHTDAFRAAEISAVTLFNSTVGEIRERAFTDRTLICDLKISKCNISKLQSNAIMAAIGNLSLSHSTITDIEPKSIVTTVAKVEIIGNQIFNFHPTGFIFNNWNKITMDDNIIKKLYSNFLVAPMNTDIEKFSFKGNEIYTIEQGALSFVADLDDRILIFDDNFFNQSCDCEMEFWLEEITNTSHKVKALMDSSFCPVNDFLSKCFSLPVGIINIRNFTEKACKNHTVCEPYNGETRTVDTTSKIFLQDDESEKQSWLIFIITVVGLFIIAIIITFVVLLVRGGRWLKRKGYFRNVHYNNDQSIEEENTIVTVDENEKLEIPEELTIEFLQTLSQRLDDPATHQEASEMIERLYEMFIVDDSYENNNRQDEEAHLYEELGNLNLQIPPPPYEEEKPQSSNGTGASPRGILRLMEEKFNSLQTEENAPKLAGDYSEPTDAAVHLYSELKNKSEKTEGAVGGSVTSNGSLKMAVRPLPSKPGDLLLEPGPSTKL